MNRVPFFLCLLFLNPSLYSQKFAENKEILIQTQKFDDRFVEDNNKITYATHYDSNTIVIDIKSSMLLINHYLEKLFTGHKKEELYRYKINYTLRFFWNPFFYPYKEREVLNRMYTNKISTEIISVIHFNSIYSFRRPQR